MKNKPMSERELKDTLNRYAIKHSLHSLQRNIERAYNDSDITLLVFQGKLRKVDRGFSHRLRKMTFTYTLHGKDRFGDWAFVVLADEGNGFRVVTIGPATNTKLFGAEVVGI